jgi:hypothetical protein
MCAINRSSIYILLGILINLSSLTVELVFSIFKGDKSLNKKLLNVTSTVVPFALAAVGFALECNVDAPHLQSTAYLRYSHTWFHFSNLRLYCLCVFVFPGEIREGENGKLNTARHAFSCSMRYAVLPIYWWNVPLTL